MKIFELMLDEINVKYRAWFSFQTTNPSWDKLTKNMSWPVLTFSADEGHQINYDFINTDLDKFQYFHFH